MKKIRTKEPCLNDKLGSHSELSKTDTVAAIKNVRTECAQVNKKNYSSLSHLRICGLMESK